MEQTALAKTIQERFSKLKMKRQGFDTLAQQVAPHVIPQRIPGLDGSAASYPTVADFERLFDTTALHGNMTLASGQVAWMCPQDSPWYAYEPGDDQSDETKLWLANATRITREALANCQFYTEVHESFLDRGGFGTCCLYVEEGKRTEINVQHWAFGTYVIDEDDEGFVDTVIREFKMSARAAVQKFGEANVSEEVRKCLADPIKCHEEHTYLHAIYPRADAERDKAKLDGPNKPIASVYIDADHKHVCRTGGYDEMPCMVSRFLKWGSAVNGLYGWGPAFSALPDARSVNHQQKMADAKAEKDAFPPMAAPDDMEGDLDMNANGVNFFTKEIFASGALPRPIQTSTTSGRDGNIERIEMRQKSIEKAFFVDMFQMFAVLDKQMTAREVAERSSEKLIQFSPTFARLTTELFNPLLERVLGIMARSGRLGEIPQGIQGTPYRIQYSSRIALALRALPAIGYHRTIERVLTIAPIVPSVVDNYDLDQAERDTALADGVPPEFLRSEKERDEMRQARADAQKAAEQQAAALAAVDAGSKVKADSPMANVLQSNIAA